MSNKNIVNNLHLNKQKIKLSLIFSFIIFLILFLLQVFFQTFRYLDYKNSTKERFNNQYDILKKINNNSDLNIGNIKEIINPKIFQRIKDFGGNPPPGEKDGKRFDNFIIYNVGDLTIANTLIDKDYANEILLKVLNNKNTDEIFEININDIEYHVINKSLGNNKSVIIFFEERMSLDDVLRELIIYFIISALFSVLIYFLVYSFVNRILTPVEENMKDMENFIHNAGHELKTPISVVKSSLQLAKLKKSYEEEVDESIAELNKMDLLIDGLLELSTINKNSFDEIYKLEDIIEERLKLYENKINDKKINLNFIKNYSTELKINREYAKMFFSNLIANAIKYNKKGGNIEIILNKNNFIIKDTGIGIKKENLEKVWERFFQESESRGNGFGIGLSLVKKIREIYKWKMKIESIESKGTTITVILTKK
ncbi:MAG: HAMP domain-containing sensor histidine kinase [Candidatus Gracilibacteria bacterium]|nr:HAMP domain-containing sensor histidine kinase [Candidatus Gracilibacteria bacterium]